MKVETSHGVISIEQVGAGDVTVLFVHGNSSCKEIFSGQLQSSLGQRHRLVAVDLPGHGQSDNARDPHRTYCIPGYADVLRRAGPDAGLHSLRGGGLVAGDTSRWSSWLEPLRRLVVVTGSPPFAKSMQSIGEAFVPSMHGADQQGGLFPKKMRLHMRERQRPPMCRRKTSAFAPHYVPMAKSGADVCGGGEGLGVDQRHTVESVAIPFAIINGSEDPFVARSCFDKPAYARLWRGSDAATRRLWHAPLNSPHSTTSFCLCSWKTA